MVKHLVFFRSAVSIVLVATALSTSLAACSMRLKGEGSVAVASQTSDPLLMVAARAIGVDLQEARHREYWLQRYKADLETSSPADLYTVDWGRELFAIAPPADDKALTGLWNRTGYSKISPPWLGEMEIGPSRGFYPTSIYMWGLFYNKQVLEDLGADEPSNLGEFEALLSKAKIAGFVPVSLGSAFGWPGAAWFTILDLRMNGADAVRERYGLTRTWDDVTGKAVANRLASWRDAGYFSLNASRNGMDESLAEVESGQALCTLMGAFAQERFSDSSKVGFTTFPPVESPSGNTSGELAGIAGFFKPPKIQGKKAETVLALMDAYLMASGASFDTYKLPLHALATENKRKAVSSAHLNPIQEIQATALKHSVSVVPAFDRTVSAQAMQNTIPLWATFFSPGGMSGDAFATALSNAVSAGEKKAP